MASQLPNIYEQSGYDREAICLCVSAIRRQPGWLLYQVHQRGLWDDLMIAALQPTVEGVTGKKEVYNAAQRGIYRFLVDSGYKKARRTQDGKTKVLWQPIMEIKNELQRD